MSDRQERGSLPGTTALQAVSRDGAAFRDQAVTEAGPPGIVIVISLNILEGRAPARPVPR